jgi:ammonium transporter Rh
LGGGGALLIGSIAGSLSTIGYAVVMPFLEERMNLFDTCGVHNLHGMPGVLGGVASVISAYFASEALYGSHIGDVFPAMAAGRSASQQVCVHNKLTSVI